MWTKLEIVLSRTDHFFGDGLSSLSFLFPPNVKHDVSGYTVLNIKSAERGGGTQPAELRVPWHRHGFVTNWGLGIDAGVIWYFILT